MTAKSLGIRRLRLTLPILMLVAVSGPPLPAQSAGRDLRIKISVDASGPSTRVILTHSRPASYEVARSGGRLLVLYTEPVLLEPARGEMESPILRGWEPEGDTILTLLLGPGFSRHESFELKNPTRLVLDLMGEATTDPITRPERYTARPSTIIVLDPGHGGVENGAVGPTGLREKDVTLELARRLKRALERIPDVSVVLTRDEDRYVELDERTAIANYNRAALFISIHLNSSRRRDALGAETYYLSADATDDEARTLAALENKSYGSEPSVTVTEGNSRKKALELVLWDLAQNQYLAESSRLAEAVQREMNVLTGTRDRGVRQAPFRVLMGATMPAILVEVGFISNPEEEATLRSSDYRNRVVEALARAVQGFLRGRARLSAPGATATVGTSQP